MRANDRNPIDQATRFPLNINIAPRNFHPMILFNQTLDKYTDMGDVIRG